MTDIALVLPAVGDVGQQTISESSEQPISRYGYSTPTHVPLFCLYSSIPLTTSLNRPHETKNGSDIKFVSNCPSPIQYSLFSSHTKHMPIHHICVASTICSSQVPLGKAFYQEDPRSELYKNECLLRFDTKSDLKVIFQLQFGCLQTLHVATMSLH